MTVHLDRRLSRLARLQNGLFALLAVALALLLGALAQEFRVQKDVTLSGRNSLSTASLTVLSRLDKPLLVTVYAGTDGPLRGQIRAALEPYLRAYPAMRLAFVDPAVEPGRTREAGVRLNGEMVVEYGGRSEHLTVLNEESVSNLLMRLARAGERQVLYLDGHGERRLDGQANHDLGDFGRQLAAKGIRTAPLNLAAVQDVPRNAALLVIAGPQVDLLPGETDKILAYLERGGSLLWLADPGSLHGLQPLAEKLGVTPLPGRVVDLQARALRLPPNVAVSAAYGYHPVTQGFDLVTVFPDTRGLAVEERPHWQTTPLVETAGEDKSWAETGPGGEHAAFDPKRDIPGPLALGVALERTRDEGSQRVAVMGGGAFLSNTFLGNGGNLDLGVNLINWLAHDDRLITIQPRARPDAGLAMTQGKAALLGLGALLGLPLLLAAVGVVTWRRRRR